MATLAEQFFRGKRIDRIPSEIENSWIRSRQYGLRPMGINLASVLDAEQLENRIHRYRKILDIATTVLDATFRGLDYENLSWAFVDPEHVILYINAKSSDMLNRLASIRLKVGATVSEDKIGTNAIALALSDGTAHAVTGPEHFCFLYECFSTFASAVRDPRGKIVGAIVCAVPYDGHIGTTVCDVLQVHLLKAATVIESKLKNREDLELLAAAINHLETTGQISSNGVMIANAAGVVLFCNRAAALFLGAEQDDVIGRSAIDLLLGYGSSLKSTSEGPVALRPSLVRQGGRQEVSLRTLPFGSQKGGPKGTVFLLSYRKQFEKRLEYPFAAIENPTFEDIVGASPAIQEVIRQGRIAARHVFPVLIEGETGTGKELLARCIHTCGLRNGTPFVAINCSAIPKELVESELFGYLGGSFTGSLREGSPGKFRAAHGGSLLLDEIDSLSLDLQVKLLRFLENGEILPVGGHRVFHVDVRVLACSSSDLGREVHKGSFRKDLYYRLNVCRIRIPPLRDRREDIPLLAEFFLRTLSSGLPNAIRLHPRALEVLKRHDWPGNVRELKNCLRYASAIAAGKEIMPTDLPNSVLYPSLSTSVVEPDKDSLEDLEKALIQRALRESGGRPLAAARLLGVSRATFYRRLRRYNLSTNS